MLERKVPGEANPPGEARLRAGVTRTQSGFCATHLRVVWGVGHLIDRSDFDDFEKVEFRCWVFLALHNQHVLEALVVGTAVKRLAVAQTVELEVFERLVNCTRVERACTVHSVRIKQRLAVNGVRSLAWREAVLGAERLGEGL